MHSCWLYGRCSCACTQNHPPQIAQRSHAAHVSCWPRRCPTWHGTCCSADRWSCAVRWQSAAAPTASASAQPPAPQPAGACSAPSSCPMCLSAPAQPAHGPSAMHQPWVQQWGATQLGTMHSSGGHQQWPSLRAGAAAAGSPNFTAPAATPAAGPGDAACHAAGAGLLLRLVPRCLSFPAPGRDTPQPRSVLLSRTHTCSTCSHGQPSHPREYLRLTGAAY